jgi:DNA invertase Pin-like site-specific DNA recombinase
MTPNIMTPAAQYLRMSTEHQQYSIENQAVAIQRYADLNGFELVRTYADPGRSGVVIKRRVGLQQLLQDVISGNAKYRAILVYDVSRWGRFLDTDEAAHYEFLCKSAGVPVHYCNEIFPNDGTLPSLVMKALKRTMAGEYSRELSVKVFAGLKRIAYLGFKQGGQPGYGFRRMMVGPNRVAKQQLNRGEHKGLASDRVVLVPGPANEIEVVHQIYKMLISDGLSVRAIACELNRKGIPYLEGAKWSYAAVHGVLTHLKYIGCHVFGRTAQKLYTPVRRLPKSQWIVISNAFRPIVDYGTFAQAQQILYWRTLNKSDRELLDGLRRVLTREGRLSSSLVEGAVDLPSLSTYGLRFGGLEKAYKLIGYGQAEQFAPIDSRRRTQAFHRELVTQLISMFPGELSVVRRGGRWRNRLQQTSGELISVLIAPSRLEGGKSLSWSIHPVQQESDHLTLLARLDARNRSFLDFHVMPNMDRKTRFRISESDHWLDRGARLENLEDFLSVVMSLRVFQHSLRTFP